MRLALLVLYAHFFMSGALAHPAAGRTVTFRLSDPRCTKSLQPLVVAAQVYDLLNTDRQFHHYPYARETDWWTARFAGPHGRSITGIALGIAVLDFVKWKLTAHSPALRCAVEGNQLETTIEAIGVTHPL